MLPTSMRSCKASCFVASRSGHSFVQCVASTPSRRPHKRLGVLGPWQRMYPARGAVCGTPTGTHEELRRCVHRSCHAMRVGGHGASPHCVALGLVVGCGVGRFDNRLAAQWLHLRLLWRAAQPTWWDQRSANAAVVLQPGRIGRLDVESVRRCQCAVAVAAGGNLHKMCLSACRPGGAWSVRAGARGPSRRSTRPHALPSGPSTIHTAVPNVQSYVVPIAP
jgi:hypothetical protein